MQQLGDAEAGNINTRCPSTSRRRLTANGRQVAFTLDVQERFISDHYAQMLIGLRTGLPPPRNRLGGRVIRLGRRSNACTSIPNDASGSRAFDNRRTTSLPGQGGDLSPVCHRAPGKGRRWTQTGSPTCVVSGRIKPRVQPGLRNRRWAVDSKQLIHKPRLVSGQLLSLRDKLAPRTVLSIKDCLPHGCVECLHLGPYDVAQGLFRTAHRPQVGDVGQKVGRLKLAPMELAGLGTDRRNDRSIRRLQERRRGRHGSLRSSAAFRPQEPDDEKQSDVPCRQRPDDPSIGHRSDLTDGTGNEPRVWTQSALPFVNTKPDEFARFMALDSHVHERGKITVTRLFRFFVRSGLSFFFSSSSCFATGLSFGSAAA